MNATRIHDIGAAILAQDNRATEAPIFIVQRKSQHIVPNGYHDQHEWCETTSGKYIRATPLRQKRLELLDDAGRETPGWECFYTCDHWEFVTACFTEQGCKDFIARDGHNLGTTRIWAAGSYRNNEWRDVRSHLIAQATQTTTTATSIWLSGQSAPLDTAKLSHDQVSLIEQRTSELAAEAGACIHTHILRTLAYNVNQPEFMTEAQLRDQLAQITLNASLTHAHVNALHAALAMTRIAQGELERTSHTIATSLALLTGVEGGAA